jgi:hypothetical protein
MKQNVWRETGGRVIGALVVGCVVGSLLGSFPGSLLGSFLSGAPRLAARPSDAWPPADARQAAVNCDPTGETRGLSIGVEYALAGMGQTLAGLEIPAVKILPDRYRWGRMQRRPTLPIDYRGLDRLVREYQEAGFTALLLAFKPNAAWASRDPLRNLAPQPRYWDQYESWVGGVVERYDGDGDSDMPGLRHAVRCFEVGVELSSFEPEPVDDYLEVLERAYRAIHAASSEAVVLHAAFLPTGAFDADPPAEAYPTLETTIKDRHHGFADMRAVLDRPDLFDAVNLHSLSDPLEIERAVRWLRWEMEGRGYEKDILISDTAPTPFMGYGDATTCSGNPGVMAIIARPASEADRCRLAEYFDRMLAGDVETIRWTWAFHAEDVVKKVVIAAEAGVGLINTAFAEDLYMLKTPGLRAGAGASAWGGMTAWDVNPFTGARRLEEIRPSFYALRQLARHLRDYERVERLETADPRIRLYHVEGPVRSFQIAWLEPERLILPGDEEPGITLELESESPRLIVEAAIRRPGVEDPARSVVEAEPEIENQVEDEARVEEEALNEAARYWFEIDLTRTPIYIFETG